MRILFATGAGLDCSSPKQAPSLLHAQGAECLLLRKSLELLSLRLDGVKQTYDI